MMQFYNIPKGESIFEKGTKPRLEYFSHTHLDCEGHARSMHRHTGVTELVFVRKGEGIHCVDTHSFRTNTGDIFIHNEGLLHEERAATCEELEVYGCGISNIHIKGLKPGAIAEGPWETKVPTGDYYEKILAVMEMLEVLVQDETQEAHEIADNIITAIIVLTRNLFKKQTEIYKDNEDSSAIVGAIRSFIDNNYTENFTLEDIGDRFGISPYYASHLFKKATGWSIIQYRQQRRIGEAQSLLTDTPYSITFIASAVGYDNSNQFTRRFTKVVGVSPRKFREQSVVKNKSGPSKKKRS